MAQRLWLCDSLAEEMSCQLDQRILSAETISTQVLFNNTEEIRSGVKRPANVLKAYCSGLKMTQRVLSSNSTLPFDYLKYHLKYGSLKANYSNF